MKKAIKEEKPYSEWTISKLECNKENLCHSITITPLDENQRTITILGNGMPKTISVPIDSKITINLKQ